MSDLSGLFNITIFIAGIIIALIILIIWIIRSSSDVTKTLRRKRKTLHIGKGRHFINKNQTPRWIKQKWCDDGIDWSYGSITEECKYAKGSHYEYKLVVVDSGHTHDCAVIRRRLKGRRGHH